MLKIILQAPRPISPFNEPARDLRIQNVPLWLWQRNLLAPHVTKEMEIPANARLPLLREPMLVYRDNLFFDEFYINEFVRLAKKRRRPVRAAFWGAGDQCPPVHAGSPGHVVHHFRRLGPVHSCPTGRHRHIRVGNNNGRFRREPATCLVQRLGGAARQSSEHRLENVACLSSYRRGLCRHDHAL